METGCYNSPLGYDNADWFVDEIIKVEIETAFFLKKIRKDIFLTREDREHFTKTDICRFCDKETLIRKVGDPCNLTGNYRGPAHNNCVINVTQTESIFFLSKLTI